MLMTDEERISVQRYEHECSLAEMTSPGGEMTMTRHLNSVMSSVVRSIMELERSAGFYHRQTTIFPQMPISHMLGVAAKSNILLNISMMSVLFIKCPEFRFEFNEFRNVLDMVYLYLQLLSRILPSSDRVTTLRQGFVSFKTLLYDMGMNHKTSNDVLFRLLALADQMMSCELSVAEEFYRLETDIRKVADMKEFMSDGMPPVKLDESSVVGMRKIIKDVARESVRIIRDKEPRSRRVASSTRKKQIDEVCKRLKDAMVKGRNLQGKGLLRCICRDVIKNWPDVGKPNYDGYPNFNALYNYCHTHHLIDNFGVSAKR